MKQKLVCKYCAAQGLTVDAVFQQLKAIKPYEVRYGCPNGHFFAVNKEIAKGTQQ